jgi:pilus assembly protein CpaB
VLRNQIDEKRLTTDGATKDTLLGIAAPAAAPAPVKTTRVRYAEHHAPKRDCIGVISGVTSTQECF